MYYVIAPTDSDMLHSRGPWKKHKYIGKKGNKYIYSKDSTIGQLSDLHSSYSKKRGRIEKTRNRQNRFADSLYNLRKPKKGQRYGMHGFGMTKEQAAAYRDVSKSYNNDYADLRTERLNKKTREKASKIIGNSAAVKKGKGLISKLAKLFKKKK